MRIPLLKGDTVAASRFRTKLSEAQGVRHVEAQPLTGSIVIHYDPAILPHAGILEILRKHGCAVIAEPPRHAQAESDRALLNSLAWLVVEKAVEQSLAAAVAAIL